MDFPMTSIGLSGLFFFWHPPNRHILIVNMQQVVGEEAYTRFQHSHWIHSVAHIVDKHMQLDEQHRLQPYTRTQWLRAWRTQ